jgi:DNA modification methylase
LKIKTNEIIYDPNVYPRFDLDNDVVNRYMTAIENLPPIVISSNKKLIDGKHRLRAHELSNVGEIEVEILDITNDTEILKEAIKRNSTHGQQLAIEEKKDLARRLWDTMIVEDMASLLSVSTGIISEWTTDLESAKKDTQRKQIIDLWLKCCYTQDDIANIVELTQGRVAQIINKFKSEKINNEQISESIQIYDIWNFGKLDQQYGQDYPGRIPGQIIENVLWYFTKPFDVVIDPMVGGGTTIDVCKSMLRRYQGYDKNKVHDDTIIHDLTTGLPESFEKADLVFMDPPYFKKKAEEYNLPEEYNTKSGFMGFAQKWVDFTNGVLKKDGIVALLISDYVDYENPDESIFSYEYVQLFKKYKMIYKISVPLSTQQYQAFHVSRAKENKQILIVGRELYIMRKC